MTTSRRVECDHCGLKVRLRADGTIAPHDHTSYRVLPQGGVVPGSRTRGQCVKSGKPYDFHRGTFYATKRGLDGKATEWGAFCRCGEKWYGPTYDSAEGQWVEHTRRERATREALTAKAGA